MWIPHPLSINSNIYQLRCSHHLPAESSVHSISIFHTVFQHRPHDLPPITAPLRQPSIPALSTFTSIPFNYDICILMNQLHLQKPPTVPSPIPSLLQHSHLCHICPLRPPVHFLQLKSSPTPLTHLTPPSITRPHETGQEIIQHTVTGWRRYQHVTV